MDVLLQDLRTGFRALVKNRGFAAVAVLTLGLGIGANTAVFSVIDAVFLRQLPYRDPDRLVVVWEDASFVGYPHNTPPPGNYLDWRAHNESFEEMGAIAPGDFSLTGDGEPERISAQAITASLLPMLGVRPAVGREFLAEEDREGGPRAALISHGLWQRRYGADPGVVGRTILLNGEKYTVVGVMPPGFQLFERRVDAWVPAAFGPEDEANRGSHYLTVLARLRPGVTVEHAQSQMQATMERIRREYPDETGQSGAAVVPLREELTGEVRKPLVVLLVAVGLVLLIACINVGNLMLSRAAGRSREIAVRAALGASRWRIARQLLTEIVPLTALGAAVGLALAYWSFALLRQLIPPAMEGSSELGLDVRVLAFTLAIAVVSSALFGLAPALEAAKVDLNDALRRASARGGISAGGRLQSALVVGEVSLAIVLLVAAGLLIQTFYMLRGQYSALHGATVLTMKTVLPKSAYDTHAKREAFFERALERVRVLPGVVSAGYTNALPLDYKGDSTGFSVEGRPPEPSIGNIACVRPVSADYLKALGVPLLRGRHFSEADGPGGQPVAVINETMARQFWPGEEAIGRRFKIGDADEDTPWVTIVGVAADVRQDGVDVPVKPETYFPYRQCDYLEWAAPRALAIRTSGDQTTLAAAARREIAAVDPSQPVSDVKTMSDILGEETSGRRLGTVLLGAFAAVALLLASIGIYGLLAQLVAQKVPEIGVRLALGARPRDVVALVVGRGMKLVAIGSAVGLVMSLALTRLMSSLLFGVGASDPLTLAGVPALLAAVALLACYVPARRAAGVDPNVALRQE
jgi:putative ABC transport system permease protein